MTIDPKWLEILKASGWQTTALAAACGLFLLGAHIGWLPSLEPWMVLAVVFAFLVCACLSLASILSTAFKHFPVHNWVARRIALQRKTREIEKYIPHMTPKEKQIIAYLLAKNQKLFTVDSDGGYAATLISMGIVVIAVRPNQPFRGTDMPVVIPDHLWNLFIKYREEFPYKPAYRGQIETHPWRVHWMAR